MRPILILVALLALADCSYKQRANAPLKATAFGAVIVESSGGKQIAPAGTLLPQPIVVQVNDQQGSAVTGAGVEFSGPGSVAFDPPSGTTDSSGQLTTNVTLGNGAGRYELTASTYDKSHTKVDLKLEETALDFQQVLGLKLNQQYCERCHNSESTPERVSNYDNLDVKPHAFTDGGYLNTMSDDDLAAIISHGGPALNKSAQMPPYGYTLSKSEIQALLAYIRAIADPPRSGRGLSYAQR